MKTMSIKRYVSGALISFLLGFSALHPFSMFLQSFTYPEFNVDLLNFPDAFTADHVLMAFFFGFLGLAIGSTVLFLTDLLSREKERVKILEGLLPICAYCHKIRNDDGKETGKGDWEHLETYISARTEADFSHGICTDCYAQEIQKIEVNKKS